MNDDKPVPMAERQSAPIPDRASKRARGQQPLLKMPHLGLDGVRWALTMCDLRVRQARAESEARADQHLSKAWPLVYSKALGLQLFTIISPWYLSTIHPSTFAIHHSPFAALFHSQQCRHLVQKTAEDGQWAGCICTDPPCLWPQDLHAVGRRSQGTMLQASCGWSATAMHSRSSTSPCHKAVSQCQARVPLPIAARPWGSMQHEFHSPLPRGIVALWQFASRVLLTNASKQCGSVWPECHRPMRLRCGAVHCVSSTPPYHKAKWRCFRRFSSAYCPQVVGQCVTKAQPPTAPRHCDGALQERHCPLPPSNVATLCGSFPPPCPPGSAAV